MNVSLIGITNPLDNKMTPEELIVHMARVSNPTSQASGTGSSGLIKYLIKNNHWSPFEMVSVVAEINTTRDIARQILRHRSFSFQEFSQRYADPTKDLDFEFREARMQDLKNRQNSISIDVTTDYTNIREEWEIEQREVIHAAKKAYKWAIDHGIAKEQARAVLPEGNTQSRLYMNGTLRSWIHYIELRSKNGTQKEHQDIALECRKIIKTNFPNVAEALEWSN